MTSRSGIYAPPFPPKARCWRGGRYGVITPARLNESNQLNELNNSMKTVLITGANRGIGFETARQLARRGFHVVVGVRSQEQGQKALGELKGASKVSLLAVDVSSSKCIVDAALKFAAIG